MRIEKKRESYMQYIFAANVTVIMRLLSDLSEGQETEAQSQCNGRRPGFIYISRGLIMEATYTHYL
jgi:hypothetical protein